MDTFRCALALALVCSFPPMLVYWPVIHGWIGFWRRLGAIRTYAVALGALTPGIVALFRLRDELLGIEFGTNRALVGREGSASPRPSGFGCSSTGTRPKS